MANEGFVNLTINNSFVYFSVLLIASIGVSHGAMDGKLIWQASSKTLMRVKISSIYLLLVLIGLVIWFVVPMAGLILLIIMSCAHFAKSDLFFTNQINTFSKYCWGISVTLLPLIFQPNEVLNIFYLLTNYEFSMVLINIVRALIVFSIILFIASAILFYQNKFEIILALFELVTLILLAIFVHPITWFAIYFCGLHGIRALIGINFNFKKDILWLTAFTIPVIVLFIFFAKENTFDLTNNLLVVFPILASLTIAHMSLNKIIRAFRNY
jgi:Brp/Blh family beta-carotene 15,15'-monooxygenase